MKVPDTAHRKALIVVDVQPDFVTERNYYIVDNIIRLLNNVHYAAIANVNFVASSDSLYKDQANWELPDDSSKDTIPVLRFELEKHQALHVTKKSRSAFAGEQDLDKYFREHNVEEVHVAGISMSDCVIATAFDAFDHGYLTYAIEECCESKTPGRNEYAREILRWQNMTNNSCLGPTRLVE